MVVMFVVLIVGILVAVDIWRVGGLVLLGIAAVIGVVTRLGFQSRRHAR
jgi:hypothetical protein